MHDGSAIIERGCKHAQGQDKANPSDQVKPNIVIHETGNTIVGRTGLERDFNALIIRFIVSCLEKRISMIYELPQSNIDIENKPYLDS